MTSLDYLECLAWVLFGCIICAGLAVVVVLAMNKLVDFMFKRPKLEKTVGIIFGIVVVIVVLAGVFWVLPFAVCESRGC